jgi:hypothetical protein
MSLVSVNKNGLVPFFAREQLIDNSLDDKTEVSFSFNPIGKIPKYSNQMNCASVMKIEHILDVNADAINYANSLKLIGCNTEAVEWLSSDKLGRSISSITTGNVSSKTFTLHVSKSGFRKTLTHLSSKPVRRHQVKDYKLNHSVIYVSKLFLGLVL